jgi:hypothetical protein|tara:strand:- start:292 stop:516 length:225 start_codon:yes stop_codon:yes gene_type:complete
LKENLPKPKSLGEKKVPPKVKKFKITKKWKIKILSEVHKWKSSKSQKVENENQNNSPKRKTLILEISEIRNLVN